MSGGLLPDVEVGIDGKTVVYAKLDKQPSGVRSRSHRRRLSEPK